MGRTQALQPTCARALGSRNIGTDTGDLTVPGISLIPLRAPTGKAEAVP